MALKYQELLGSSKPLTIINGKVSTVIEKNSKLMVIMDEFSTTALEPDAELFKPTPENWERMLADNEVDSLIVESAWVGNSEVGIRKWAGIAMMKFQTLGI